MPRVDERSRYVVLHHTGWGEDHFDLMVEPSQGAAKLLTWRTQRWPLVDGEILTPLGEHRREYLDYEGPVSGGRGEVRRTAEGTCALASAAQGVARVRFEDGEEWLLSGLAKRVQGQR